MPQQAVQCARALPHCMNAARGGSALAMTHGTPRYLRAGKPSPRLSTSTSTLCSPGTVKPAPAHFPRRTCGLHGKIVLYYYLVCSRAQGSERPQRRCVCVTSGRGLGHSGPSAPRPPEDSLFKILCKLPSKSKAHWLSAQVATVTFRPILDAVTWAGSRPDSGRSVPARQAAPTPVLPGRPAAS